MKHTLLSISILIFLMSGVMCLFPNSEVHAQVPQTKRSDQDSFLKNIRSKKKNNDLQKARRVNGDNFDSSKIRLRFLGMGTIEKDSAKSSTTSDYIIWNEWGIGQSEFNHKITISEKIKFKLKKIKFHEISYSFGDKLTFTIGGGIISSGEASISIVTTEDEFISKEIDGTSFFGILGLEFDFIEILWGYRTQNVEVNNFNSKVIGSSISENYIVSGVQSLFGFGLSF